MVVMFNSVANISVSSNPKLRQNVQEMGSWLEQQLRDCGVDTKQVDLNNFFPTPPLPPLPNLVLGKINAPGKNLKTVLVYGHYDVQPVSGFSDQPCYILAYANVVSGRAR
jgi:Cys-Gly metallodipeptidase DUG1